MKDMIGKKSEAQGFKKSRLPVFTDEEKTELKGKSKINSLPNDNFFD